MNSEEFRKEHNRILSQYGITFMNNCDFIGAVTGNIYHKDDEFICHIVGISYDRDGDWQGRLEEYLVELESAVRETLNLPEIKHKRGEASAEHF